MKPHRRIAVLGVLAMTSGAAASLPVNAAVGTQTSTVAQNVKIKVGDNYFKPKKVTVTVGDTVIFKWIGTAIHDVKVKKGPAKFESKKQSSGKFKREILQPGDYKIVCTLHPGMDMKLTAVAAPVTTTTAPPTATP